jgi:Ca-activated chloride channel homolog
MMFRNLRYFNHVYVTQLIYVLTFVFASRFPAGAQVDLNQASISPPTHLLETSSSDSLVRANVDLVLLNVTVLDHLDRAVAGLQQSDFTVQDNDKPRTVRYVYSIDEPASLVIVLDASASMSNKIDGAREAVRELSKNSNPQDEFAVVVVSTAPYVALHFDESADELQSAIDHIQPQGFTALWDGMYLGIQELRLAHHRRRAMIVISDGGDNHSRRTQPEVKSVLEEANAEMYAIGIFDSLVHTFEEKLGPSHLDELASVTGGQLFLVKDARELPQAMNQISQELRNQYVLGYYTGDEDRNGKWHKVKVRLSGPASHSKYRLYSQNGYYANLQ